MDPLYRQAIVRSAVGLVCFLALIFGTAGTWNYWQGWLFLATFSLSTTAFSVYLALYDRPLFERRMKAGPRYEKEMSQKIIIILMMAVFIALIVVPIIDHAHEWSPVPTWVSIAGNILIVLSFLAIFFVLKTNSWAASNVGVEGNQQVIDFGPYAYVRHPMYAGALLLCAGIPLALGAWWPIGLVVAFFPILMWRLLDEERILARDLQGYTEYMHRVQYRLLPYVW